MIKNLTCDLSYILANQYTTFLLYRNTPDERVNDLTNLASRTLKFCSLV